MATPERQAVTMARSYSRDDVQTHSDGFRDSLPAVNVKVHRTIDDAWSQYETQERMNDGYTLEWIEENITEEQLDWIFQQACESEYEYLEGWATGTDGGEDPLFPDDNVTLEVQGRSGGWIAVRGLPDIEEWDAVRLARWRRFERIAQNIADGIPCQMLSLIELNNYQWAIDESEEAARAARQDIATMEA
jgi:hypothetical protein